MIPLLSSTITVSTHGLHHQVHCGHCDSCSFQRLVLLQERALQHLQSCLTAFTTTPQVLPRLFAATASSSQPIRAQALDCLVKASTDLDLADGLVSNDELLEPAALQALLAAVAEHHAEILSDGQGFVQVVRRLLVHAGAKHRSERDMFCLSSLCRLHKHEVPDAVM